MSHAVGSLVRARGREWVVLPDSDDDLLVLRPVSGSDDETTGVLLSLEGREVQPATFPLPQPEEIGDFRSSGLLRDALRLGFRASAGPFRSFGRIAVSPRPYQLVPLLMALRLDPVRMLIADDVGVGKTIESLLIAREMIDQGDVQRLTVLCSPQLAEQWQHEMRDKFHLDAQLVLPSTVNRLERHLPPRVSLFDHYPYTVVSTDYIKSDRRRNDFLQAAPELVIVDEAHTCVAAQTGSGPGRGAHQRHQLLLGLTKDTDRHLLLLTATPHSGNEDAFRSLLALLDRRFLDLPADLSGPQNEPHRRDLARQLVQRKRGDILHYAGEDTTFPQRETTELTYALTPAYAQLFERCLDLARETALDDTGGAHRQRVRWWSALALLRSLASSPAAAASTLRNRAAAAETATVEEADDVGRRTVLDLADDESAESIDVLPGSDASDPDNATDADTRYRRTLRELARQADELAGPDGDAKLRTAIEAVQRLVKDGFNPILFCRFIPTAEYLAEHLRDALGKKATVAAVVGYLPPSEREARVEQLGQSDGPRVLVATDCMSEGINLQHHFDAVVHYDLSWNPTRHEQREGRVDRFGQRRGTVRTVTYWGTDNQIDGIVLDVLLRKHAAIRRDTGISVPVPGDTNKIVEAVMEGVLLRTGHGQQLQLSEVVEAEQRDLFAEWERAADREKRSRSMFAQESIRPEEVVPAIEEVRRTVGGDDLVGRFVTDASAALGAQVTTRASGGVELDYTEAPGALQDRLGPGLRSLTARFDPSTAGDERYVSRTHPLVEQLSQYLLDTALDPHIDGPATRCGAMRTSAVSVRTTLLLVRFRANLVQTSDTGERPMLAEDAQVLAFTGAPDAAQWLPAADADALFDARPDGNVQPDQARTFVQRVIDGWAHLAPQLDDYAETFASDLLDQHRRIRDAARRKGVRFHCTPHPPDVLGLYVLLPAGGA